MVPEYKTVEDLLDDIGDPEFSAECKDWMASHTKCRELVVARHRAGLTDRQLAKRLRWKVSEVRWIEQQSNDVMPERRRKAYLEACGSYC